MKGGYNHPVTRKRARKKRVLNPVRSEGRGEKSGKDASLPDIEGIVLVAIKLISAFPFMRFRGGRIAGDNMYNMGTVIKG